MGDGCRADVLAWSRAALIVLFLFTGVLGHGPWKQDEPYIFGIVQHFLRTDTWLIPVNAGIPFMEKPPLYYWTAVLSCKLFGGVLALPDAARLASVFYMAVTASFMWKLSGVLFARLAQRGELQWSALFLLLGSLGVVRFAHEMTTDIALLAASTIALYGMALLVNAPENYKKAGFWIGLGVGAAFLAKGLFMPAVLALSGLFLCFALPALRSRKTCVAMGIAVLVAAPFLLIWPALLYQHSPELFAEWLWQNNIGRFAGFSVHRLGAENQFLYFLRIAPFFAFPAFPLACVAGLINGRPWRRPEFLLPAAVSCVGLITLLVSATGRAQYLLPLMPAFAVLGAQGLLCLPPRFLRLWSTLICMAGTTVVVGCWLLWWALLHPAPEGLLHAFAVPFGKWLPLDFVPQGNHLMELLFSAVLMLFWLATLRWKASGPEEATRLWLGAMTVLWGTIFTLLLPWIDVTRGYDAVFTEMEHAIGNTSACIAMHPSLGESVAPLLEYYKGGELPRMDFSGTTCPFLLDITTREAPPSADAHWHMVWKGSRLLDAKNEQLRLYQRAN